MHPTTLTPTALNSPWIGQPQRTEWFSSAQFGLLLHYLYPVEAAEQLELRPLVRAIAKTGARYVIWTLGQNSGHFCSPNEAYDGYGGFRPGERCSKRDIPKELAAALANEGVRLMLYLPSNAPAEDPKAAAGLGVSEKLGYDWKATPELAERWSDVIACWATRYGTEVSGWWFDGWFDWDGFTDFPFGEAYARAVRSGNPNAILCLNRGVEFGIRRASPFEDYTAGERNAFCLEETPSSRWVDGAHWHACSFVGPGWGERGTAYYTEFLVAYGNACASRGGTVTFDIAISSNGDLDPAQVAQLAALRSTLP